MVSMREATGSYRSSESMTASEQLHALIGKMLALSRSSDCPGQLTSIQQSALVILTGQSLYVHFFPFRLKIQGGSDTDCSGLGTRPRDSRAHQQQKSKSVRCLHANCKDQVSQQSYADPEKQQ